MDADRNLRHSVAALAIIRREEYGQTCWLAQWNRNWNAYAFIGGHKREEESFRECVIREIEEELGLKYETDFEVSEDPITHLEYTAWSESARQETEYEFELFSVEVAGSAIPKIGAETTNRWLSGDEIDKLQTAGQQRISPTTKMILTKVDLG